MNGNLVGAMGGLVEGATDATKSYYEKCGYSPVELEQSDYDGNYYLPGTVPVPNIEDVRVQKLSQNDMSCQLHIYGLYPEIKQNTITTNFKLEPNSVLYRKKAEVMMKFINKCTNRHDSIKKQITLETDVKKLLALKIDYENIRR
jgi:hypothetical protein